MLFVKWLFRYPSLSSKTVDLVLLVIDWWYKFMNHTSEYWYMGSILARSDIQKNSTEECLDTGTY